MDDIIFKTKDKENFRIPFPTPGTKCPDTKLESQNKDIQQANGDVDDD